VVWPPAGDRPAPELGIGVQAVVTDRTGGVSKPPYDSMNLGAGSGDDPQAVAVNRDRLAAACGLRAADVGWLRQVHGTAVRYVDDPAGGQLAEPADASFTDVPGLALAVLAADCLPVLLADPVARVVGAAHAGREGMAAGVVPALVSAMTTAGARPDRMRAVLGPAICGGCYEVPAQLRDRIAACVPAARCRTRAGTPGLDISAGVASQLAGLGVAAVAADGRCTRESAELFSYRRDGPTGRFAALVWLTQ
jgi:polyphenol oxidase